MPLYDDIISSETTGNKKLGSSSSHSSGIKLLLDHLQTKKRINQHQSSDGTSKTSNASITANNKNRSTVITASIHNSHNAGSGSLLGGEWDPNDEYDPMWPNEYEILQRQFMEEEERKRAEEYELRQKSKQSVDSPKYAGATMMTSLRGMQDYDEDDDDDDNIGHKSVTTPRPNRGTAIAPPPSLLGSAKIIKHSDGSSTNEQSISTNQAITLTSSGFGVSSVAAKIMSKMGYKEGQGLGKDEQGISRALEVEKTSLNSGKIIAETKASISSFVSPKSNIDIIKQVNKSENIIQASSDSKKETITELIKNPTKVILLRNMVGPGEVDDDLEGETKEECSKYGEVIRCLIFEIPNKKVSDDEAVRIFLEFRRVESAIKAVVDLNGRYFGGRVVKASFYEVDKFNRFELAPDELIKR